MLKGFVSRLRDLFRAAPVATAGESLAARAAGLEKKVLALVEHMPPLPATVTRAMALADDPDVTFADLAQVIEQDAAIATALLRVANSAVYASSAAALNLPQAVGRLGLWQCKNLIVGIGMRNLMRGVNGAARERCELLWQHGHATAALCSRINAAFRLGFRGEEFSCGLLHDLGRILVAMADPDSSDRMGGADFAEPADQLDRERQAVGVDHCALGGWFAEHAGLPDALVRAIRQHHAPDPTDGLSALVAAADHLANHLALGRSVNTYQVETNRGLDVLSAGWNARRRERLFADVPTFLAEVEG